MSLNSDESAEPENGSNLVRLKMKLNFIFLHKTCSFPAIMKL